MTITEAAYRTHSPIPPFLPGDKATLMEAREQVPAGADVTVVDIHDLSPDGWMYRIAHDDSRLVVNVSALEPRT